MPLCHRREYLDLNFFFSCYHDRFDFDLLKHLEFINHERNTRLNEDGLILQLARSRKVCTKYCFINRIVQMWNQLPHHIRTIELDNNGKTCKFKRVIKSWYLENKMLSFQINDSCTWISFCSYAKFRVYWQQ